jgi:hypothetical protein
MEARMGGGNGWLTSKVGCLSFSVRVLPCSPSLARSPASLLASVQH